jgi:hypothetical protein
MGFMVENSEVKFLFPAYCKRAHMCYFQLSKGSKTLLTYAVMMMSPVRK